MVKSCEINEWSLKVFQLRYYLEVNFIVVTGMQMRPECSYRLQKGCITRSRVTDILDYLATSMEYIFEIEISV